MLLRLSSDRREGRDEKTLYEFARVSDSDGGSGRDYQKVLSFDVSTLHPRPPPLGPLFIGPRGGKRRNARWCSRQCERSTRSKRCCNLIWNGFWTSDICISINYSLDRNRWLFLIIKDYFYSIFCGFLTFAKIYFSRIFFVYRFIAYSTILFSRSDFWLDLCFALSFEFSIGSGTFPAAIQNLNILPKFLVSIFFFFFFFV